MSYFVDLEYNVVAFDDIALGLDPLGVILSKNITHTVLIESEVSDALDIHSCFFCLLTFEHS